MNKPITNVWHTFSNLICLYNLSPTSVLGDFDFRYIEFMCKKPKIYPETTSPHMIVICVTVIVAYL